MRLHGSNASALAFQAIAEDLDTFEAPFVVDASRPPVPADFTARLNEFVEANQSGKAVRYFMTEGVHLSAFIVFMMRFMSAWSKMKALANSAVYDAQILKNNGAGKPLDARQWTAATAPTLVIAGGKSPAWMRNAMQALAAALSDAKYTILEGQMHIVQAEAIAPILIDFFKS